MKRHGAIALLVIAALLLVALLALRLLMRPQVLGPRVLAMAGDALGLQIEAATFDYRLRGTPQLVARNVVARAPGDAAPMLSAERVLVSVPWSTLRSRGADPVITRIELDAPVVDLASLRRWWSARPPGEGPPPTLREGLHVVRGRAIGDGWKVDGIALDLPEFSPQRAVRMHLRGRYSAGTLRMPFDLHAAMTRPAMDAGIGVAGALAPQGEDWRLPSSIVLSTRLQDGGDAGIRLRALRLSSRSSYRSGDAAQAFAFGFAAEGAAAGGGLQLRPVALDLRGRDLIPRLRAGGAIAFADDLALQLDGTLAEWPGAWPALPPPLGQSQAPLPFALRYRGTFALADPLALRLERDGARFEGLLRVPALAQWIGDMDGGSPLPPLSGRLQAPRIDVSGAELHGVEIEFDDGGVPAEASP